MTFDTFTYAEGLKKSGIPDEQVKALTEELTKALKSEDLATKQDIKDLAIATKQDIAELSAVTRQNIAELSAATKQDIAATKQDIRNLAATTKQDIAELKTDMTRWVTGMMAAQTGIIVTIVIAAIKLF